MKHYLSLHLEAALQAFKALFKQPLGTLLVLLMLAVAMTLPLALYLGVQSSGAVLGRLNEAPQITLYLNHEADSAAAEHIRAKLSADPRIEKADFVSKQEGMRELQQAFQGQDLVSMLDSNPLPDVFAVSPRDGLTPEEQTALQQDLAALPQVDSAQMDAEWMQTLYQINTFVHQVFRFLALTLGVAFVLVAHNTIRLQILSRKEEIEITKLLGAPASFIHRPFIYQAVWQSALAAGLSLLLCGWLVQTTRPLINRIFRPYGLHLDWRFFHGWEIAVVFAVVCGLGALGAWLAGSRHLLSFKARS
ncbi:permease-like cell division protein FtsX [Neisseria shayeganii]|uniref:Cell division protein FtsX n=1 Tax=Neisseria shayeganii 871 TaxID=1032488 RepID=G4CL33_9NEIS|nr:permease-like cell division protein FtsX [Neisseria shayeganii]EGY51467.1 cell division protein FtsX [Neisseria shayeganii 871]